MTEKLKVIAFKRVLYRIAAVMLASAAGISGIALAIQIQRLWPILISVILGFLSYGLWANTFWTLEIRANGILLARKGAQCFLPWLAVGEFAPGRGNYRHKVEYSLCSDKPLADEYQGIAWFKLRNPRFLPDTFGLSAKELADLLNRNMAARTQQTSRAVAGKLSSTD